MQIIGHGVDIVPLTGVRLLFEEGLLNHWTSALLPQEVLEAGSPAENRYIQSLAGQFALMEAVCKAYGYLSHTEISWNDIYVKKQPTGQISVELSDQLACHCQNFGITDWLVSLEYTDETAVGSAIAIA